MSPGPEKEIDAARAPRPGEDGIVRVLQLTDSHLYADPAGTLAGMNTLNAFDQVLAAAAPCAATADCVLATGDLVHDATPEGYGVMAERIQRLGRPVYCLPGNHDIPDVMEESLNQGLVSTPKSARFGGWLIVLLDSTLPGRPGGALSAVELARLQSLLDAHADHHVLVSLHHQPVPIGSGWMDRMALANPAPFFEIIDGHSGVRGILWGHIHQTFEAERAGVRLMGSPSTCIQFTPGRARFGIDRVAPGYRWLDLHPDGRIRSGVERIAAIPAGIDMETAGYS